MWKWLTLLLIIVAVVLLGAPYGMGIMAEKQISKLASDASRTPNMSVTVMDYNRGWFKSKAQIEVSVQVPNRKGSARRSTTMTQQPAMRTFRFKINENIVHGPIIFKDGVKLGQGFVRSDVSLTSQQQQMLNMMFTVQGATPHAVLSMLIKIDGGVITNVDVPAFTLVAKRKQGSLKWLGMSGYWNVAADMKRVTGRLTMDGANVDSKKAQIQIGKMDVKYNEKEDGAGIWVGDVKFSFPDISVMMGGKALFKMSGMEMTSDSSVNAQKLLDSTLNFDMAKLMIKDVAYGPATYRSTLKNLDTQTLLKIQKQAQSANDANLSPQQQRLMLMSLLPLIPDVFSKGAVFDLQKLSVTLPQGVVNANGKVSMPNTDTTKGQKMSMQQAYKAIDANFNLELPIAVAKKAVSTMMARKLTKRQALQRALAQQLQQQGNGSNPSMQPLSRQQIQVQAQESADKQLQQWVSAGFLAQEGSTYKMKATLQKGELTVNGKSMFGGTAANQSSMGTTTATPSSGPQPGATPPPPAPGSAQAAPPPVPQQPAVN